MTDFGISVSKANKSELFCAYPEERYWNVFSVNLPKILVLWFEIGGTHLINFTYRIPLLSFLVGHSASYIIYYYYILTLVHRAPKESIHFVSQ